MPLQSSTSLPPHWQEMKRMVPASLTCLNVNPPTTGTGALRSAVKLKTRILNLTTIDTEQQTWQTA